MLFLINSFCRIALLKLSGVIFQSLKAQVNNEVTQFMRYLHDVAKMCADDYNFISQGAMHYSEVLMLQGLRPCDACSQAFIHRVHICFSGFLQELFGVHWDNPSALPNPRDD